MKPRTRRVLAVASLGIGAVLATGCLYAPRRRGSGPVFEPTRVPRVERLVPVAEPVAETVVTPLVESNDQATERVAVRFGPRRRPRLEPFVEALVPEPVMEVSVSTGPEQQTAEPEKTETKARKRRRLSRRKLAGLVLACLMVVGGIATTNGSFSAQTRNPGNAFATGSLVLANTKQSSTTCLSTGGGNTDSNVNTACEQLINVSVRKPGDSTTGKVTLRNAGSINASALQFHQSACAASNAPGETFNGTGNICNVVSVYVQEYSDSGFTTPSSCRYGGGNTTTCAFDAAKTLTTLASAYTSVSPLGLNGVNAGVSRYFEIGVQLQSAADNTMQGRQATFDLNWVLQQ